MIINFYNVGGGGGTGGTTNYNELSNKPQINSVVLSGNVSSDQLGIASDKIQAVSGTPSATTNGNVFAVANSSGLSIQQAKVIPYTHWYLEDDWLFKLIYNNNFDFPSTDNVLALVPGGEGGILRAGVNSSGFYVDYSTDNGETWTTGFSGINEGFDDWLWDLGGGIGNVCVQADPNEKYFLFHFNGNSKTGYTLYDLAGQSETEYINYKDYSNLDNKPQINGVELTGNKSTGDLQIHSNVLFAVDTMLQKSVNGIEAGGNYGSYTVFSTDWDGVSDMPLSFYVEQDGQTKQTPYYSGGTWYGETSEFRHTYINGKFFCENGNWWTITSVATGQVTSATTFYKDIQQVIGGEWIDQAGNVVPVTAKDEDGFHQDMGIYQYNGYVWIK